MRKMHLKRRIKNRDFRMLEDTLSVGAPVSGHKVSKHVGSKKRKKRKKK